MISIIRGGNHDQVMDAIMINLFSDALQTSESSDPFTFFNFEALPLGRSYLEDNDMQYRGGPTKIEVNIE